jgi:hypothetical protein
MMNLIPLPSEGELTLTRAELASVTGTPQPRLQIEWLKAHGWKFTLTRGHEPIVGRLYANLKLGGVELAAVTIGSTEEEWTPNAAAIGA